MPNKGQTQNCSEDLLHQTYVESVDRILGTKDHTTFTFPKKILKERVSFWDSFFTKYTSQVSDEVELDIATLEPCLKQPVFKSLEAVQFWVNTGYLPSGKEILHMHNVCQTETDVSICEEQLNSVHDYVEEEKLNPHHQRLGCIDSYSSSSVDTTTYILSNMNTTNKAHTMAIMGGARHSTIMNSHCKQNVGVTQVLTECENNDRAIAVHSNQNNYDHCSRESFTMSKHMLQQKSTDVGRRSTSKWLISRISDDKNGGSHTEPNLANMQLLKHERNRMENDEIYDSIAKIGLRKKLYTVSESPVDILDMKSNNKTIISKKVKHWHPALDLGYKSRKKCKILKKHKEMTFGMFNNSLLRSRRFSNLSHRKQKGKNKAENLNSTCKAMNEQIEWNGNVSNNCSVKMNSLLDKSSIETVDKLRQTENKSSMSSECEENGNKNICKKVNNVTKKLKILNSVVCLQRLPCVEIEKNTKLKKVVTNQKHEISNKINFEKLNPVVSLRKLTKLDIQKYKISDAKLHPVVRLKRLSELEIQKYMKIPNTAFDNPSPKIRLKSLSNSDIPENNMSYNKTTSISSIPTTISHQSNHSMIICNNQILGSKRKCNGREREFMNTLSNKVEDIMENKCSMTRRSDTISPKYNKSSNISLKTLKANENISRKKKSCTNSTASSSDITETTSISSHDNINKKNNNKKSFTLNISDDDDEFVRFIHCTEEVLELQRRKYYKRLTRTFNGGGKEGKGGCTTNNSIKGLRKCRKISTDYKVSRGSITDDSEY